MNDGNSEGTTQTSDRELARSPVAWRAMGHGYWQAFDALWSVAQTRDRDRDDLYLMPLVFLLRHTVELMLKAGIARIAECHPDVDLRRLCHTHDLNALKDTVDHYAPTAIAPEIESVIVALVQLDPTGHEFRYPANNSFDALSESWSQSSHTCMRDVCARASSLRGQVHAIETGVRRALGG